MLFQIIFSLLFILPLFGTMSVLFQCLKNEMKKKQMEDAKVSLPKVFGYSLLTLIGVYIALFLLGLIWIPDFDLPHVIKTISFCLSAPYLLGVLSISFSARNITATGGASSKLTNTVSESITEG